MNEKVNEFTLDLKKVDKELFSGDYEKSCNDKSKQPKYLGKFIKYIYSVEQKTLLEQEKAFLININNEQKLFVFCHGVDENFKDEYNTPEKLNASLVNLNSINDYDRVYVCNKDKNNKTLYIVYKNILNGRKIQPCCTRKNPKEPEKKSITQLFKKTYKKYLKKNEYGELPDDINILLYSCYSDLTKYKFTRFGVDINFDSCLKCLVYSYEKTYLKKLKDIKTIKQELNELQNNYNLINDKYNFDYEGNTFFDPNKMLPVLEDYFKLNIIILSNENINYNYIFNKKNINKDYIILYETPGSITSNIIGIPLQYEIICPLNDENKYSKLIYKYNDHENFIKNLLNILLEYSNSSIINLDFNTKLINQSYDFNNNIRYLIFENDITVYTSPINSFDTEMFSEEVDIKQSLKINDKNKVLQFLQKENINEYENYYD